MSPVEIEDVLLTIPQVINAFVTLVTLVDRGPICVAMLEGAITKEEILTICKHYLPAARIPRKVIFFDSMPRTPSGKTDLAETEAYVLGQCKRVASQ